ncbi:hypothetical protein ETA_18920 [Erwinia tasmaniensis Et1/99]|uniref:Uncharacterized protein n=1 Tax=Erwinia tasmaniensis (strain DSM 17950 / CFBP 7177 / CIP 109463 / NCPPB 4357 / Et1/99) TaxID=465817 RepID=B2VEH5_ERWT9|nr:hypothetical protein ETA_18920 [Erwinia tasmaniensis Et1/99]
MALNFSQIRSNDRVFLKYHISASPGKLQIQLEVVPVATGRLSGRYVNFINMREKSCDKTQSRQINMNEIHLPTDLFSLLIERKSLG